MEINIEKLPNKLDPQFLIQEEIKKRYGSVCPFCGETKSFLDYSVFKGLGLSSNYTWYGKQYEVNPSKQKIPFLKLIKSWFQPSRHWEILSFNCFTCGGKWLTPAFPTEDLLDEKTKQSIYKMIHGIKD